MGRPKKYNTEEERKAAHREADKRWRENNKDKIHEYRQNNKEKIAEYQAEYRSSHKDEKAAYATEYYQQHMDKIAEYNAEYYQKNKEKITEHNAEYYQNNKDKIHEYRQNNKEKIAEQRSLYALTPKGRALNLLSGYKQKDKKYNRGECTLTADWIVENIFTQPCHYCGERDWHLLGCDRLDNTKPHTPENVVCSCWDCNNKKHTTPYEEYLEQINKSDTD